jgi:hypothetical protein
MLVAEMMILAGEAVGQLGAAASLPLPFRGQEAPQLPPEAVLSALPDGPVKGFALRKCMTRSVVSPQPVRHASLALDAYVQVTSPIRRYTDIIAHFNLKVCIRLFSLGWVHTCLTVCSRVFPLPAVCLSGSYSGVAQAAWARRQHQQGLPSLCPRACHTLVAQTTCSAEGAALSPHCAGTPAG